jgi:hypothetical protein
MSNLISKVKIGEIGKVIELDVMDAKSKFVDLTGKVVYFTMEKEGVKPVELALCVNDSDQSERYSAQNPSATGNRGLTRYTFGTAVNNLQEGDYHGELCVVDGANKLFYPNSDTPKKDYLIIKVSKPLAVPPS